MKLGRQGFRCASLMSAGPPLSKTKSCKVNVLSWTHRRHWKQATTTSCKVNVLSWTHWRHWKRGSGPVLCTVTHTLTHGNTALSADWHSTIWHCRQSNNQQSGNGEEVGRLALGKIARSQDTTKQAEQVVCASEDLLRILSHYLAGTKSMTSHRRTIANTPTSYACH